MTNVIPSQTLWCRLRCAEKIIIAGRVLGVKVHISLLMVLQSARWRLIADLYTEANYLCIHTRTHKTTPASLLLFSADRRRTRWLNPSGKDVQPVPWGCVDLQKVQLIARSLFSDGTQSSCCATPGRWDGDSYESKTAFWILSSSTALRTFLQDFENGRSFLSKNLMSWNWVCDLILNHIMQNVQEVTCTVLPSK